MSPIPQNSPDDLCAEILAEARRECEAILENARKQVAVIGAAVSAEAENIGRELSAQAEAEGNRRRDFTLATVGVEAAQLRSARIEMLLESVREKIRNQLATDSVTPETIIALAMESLERMRGDRFVAKIFGAVFPPGELESEIKRRLTSRKLELTVVAETGADNPGVIVEDANGFQLWDNRLVSRLNRMWPGLRRQIAVQLKLIEAPLEAGHE